MKMVERQFNARRMLLCKSDVEHLATMPRVSTDGVTGTVECEECGAAMVVVDILTVDRNPTWASLSYDRGAPLYTTAKLHPIAMLSTLAQDVEKAT